MAETPGSGAGPARWIAVGAAGVALVAAVVFLRSEPEPAPVADPEPVAAAPEATETPPVSQVEESEEDVAESITLEAETADSVKETAATADTADSEESAETTEVETPAPAAAEPPAFDVVRVEPDGSALIAGTATPGANVRILIDGVEVGQALADAAGEFVALLSIGVSEAPRVVSLSAGEAGGETVASAQSLIVAPSPEPVDTPEDVASVETEAQTPEAAEVTAEEPMAEAAPAEDAEAPSPEETAEAEAADGAAEETVAEVPPAASSETAEPIEEAVADAAALASDQLTEKPTSEEVAATEADTSAGEAETTEPEAPAAPTVLLADDTGVRVLQSPEMSPEAMDNIVIDTITYDAEGEVVLSGRGTDEKGVVRLYLDNRPVGELAIEEGGNWRAPLPDVDTGVYTLRVDEVDAEGRVTSRIETPFKREDRGAIRALEAEARDSAAPLQIITVQEGNTLWGISQGAYGEGSLYVRLFEANKERIQDPDLIYPGQIFTVPN